MDDDIIKINADISVDPQAVTCIVCEENTTPVCREPAGLNERRYYVRIHFHGGTMLDGPYIDEDLCRKRAKELRLRVNEARQESVNKRWIKLREEVRIVMREELDRIAKVNLIENFALLTEEMRHKAEDLRRTVEAKQSAAQDIHSLRQEMKEKLGEKAEEKIGERAQEHFEKRQEKAATDTSPATDMTEMTDRLAREQSGQPAKEGREGEE